MEVEGQCQMGRTKKDKRKILNLAGVGKPNVWYLNDYQKQGPSNKDTGTIPVPDILLHE